MAKEKLSKRRQQIYDYICKHTAEHGYPPSVREIGRQVNLASTSTVASHLKKLEDLGYIKRDPNKPRTLKIVGENPYEKTGEVEIVESDDVISVPLVGRVAAGEPILATENIESNISLPTEIFGENATFILQVKGESMINIGINNNDYIIVKQQNTAYNGEVVVAMIEDSATVKTFYKEENRIRLQPENDYMDPIYAENPTILGKVVGLFRSM